MRVSGSVIDDDEDWGCYSKGWTICDNSGNCIRIVCSVFLFASTWNFCFFFQVHKCSFLFFIDLVSMNWIINFTFGQIFENSHFAFILNIFKRKVSLFSENQRKIKLFHFEYCWKVIHRRYVLMVNRKKNLEMNELRMLLMLCMHWYKWIVFGIASGDRIVCIKDVSLFDGDSQRNTQRSVRHEKVNRKRFRNTFIATRHTHMYVTVKCQLNCYKLQDKYIESSIECDSQEFIHLCVYKRNTHWVINRHYQITHTRRVCRIKNASTLYIICPSYDSIEIRIPAIQWMKLPRIFRFFLAIPLYSFGKWLMPYQNFSHVYKMCEC